MLALQSTKDTPKSVLKGAKNSCHESDLAISLSTDNTPKDVLPHITFRNFVLKNSSKESQHILSHLLLDGSTESESRWEHFHRYGLKGSQYEFNAILVCMCGIPSMIGFLMFIIPIASFFSGEPDWGISRAILSSLPGFLTLICSFSLAVFLGYKKFTSLTLKSSMKLILGERNISNHTKLNKRELLKINSPEWEHFTDEISKELELNSIEMIEFEELLKDYLEQGYSTDDLSLGDLSGGFCKHHLNGLKVFKTSDAYIKSRALSIRSMIGLNK